MLLLGKLVFGEQGDKQMKLESYHDVSQADSRKKKISSLYRFGAISHQEASLYPGFVDCCLVRPSYMCIVHVHSRACQGIKSEKYNSMD